MTNPYDGTVFSLEVLPATPDVVETSRTVLHGRAQSLIERIAHQYNFPASRKERESSRYKSLFDSSKDQQLMSCLCRNLDTLASWRILEDIQGASKQTVTRGYVHMFKSTSEIKKEVEEQSEIRSRAQRLLIKEWYQEAFTIAINSALIVEKEGAPGYMIGHSLLVQEIEWNKESPFRTALNPQFLNRLHNGSFWENLEGLSRGDNEGISYVHIDDILRNHYADLTPVWLPQGVRIHERNTYKGKHCERMNYYPEHLPIKSFVRLARFFQSLDENLTPLQISQERFGYVVAPLARTIIRLTEGITNREMDYMSMSEIRKRDRLIGISRTLSEMPIVQKYKDYNTKRKESNVA